jgi:hypothetical protein
VFKLCDRISRSPKLSPGVRKSTVTKDADTDTRPVFTVYCYDSDFNKNLLMPQYSSPRHKASRCSPT